jgi:hypothetical protein
MDPVGERERILREHRDQRRTISAAQQADYGKLQVERDRLAAQLAEALSLLREAQAHMNWPSAVPTGRRLRWAADVDALGEGT